MDPPGVAQTVQWTHWDDLVNIYGVERDGYARSTWDNVGVQYGLKALADGHITPAEFLDLNATVGGWKRPQRHGAGGLPVHVGRLCRCRPSSTRGAPRNMRLSPDGGATPAPRREGDRAGDARRVPARAGLHAARSTSRSSTGATTSKTS